MYFQTNQSDSILYGIWTDSPVQRYVSVSITSEGHVYVEVDLGNGPLGGETTNEVADDNWYMLTLILNNENIVVKLDEDYIIVRLNEENQDFFFNTELYIGHALPTSRGELLFHVNKKSYWMTNKTGPQANAFEIRVGAHL